MTLRVTDLPEGPIARRFYEHVFDDRLLGPLFPDQSLRHPERLALYLAEIFRGDGRYARERGGLPTLVARHRGWRFTDAQRKRWVALMDRSLEENGVGAEMRAGLIAYFEETAMLAKHESWQGQVKRSIDQT